MAKGAAVAKRAEIRSAREEKRIAGNLANAMLPLLRRALDEAVDAGAHTVYGEVVEADAHAEEAIASHFEECNKRILEANAQIDQARKERDDRVAAADERTAGAKRERDVARASVADEREKRVKAEAERDRLRQQLGIARKHLDEAKLENG
jgi:hypothetical protein